MLKLICNDACYELTDEEAQGLGESLIIGATSEDFWNARGRVWPSTSNPDPELIRRLPFLFLAVARVRPAVDSMATIPLQVGQLRSVLQAAYPPPAPVDWEPGATPPT